MAEKFTSQVHSILSAHIPNKIVKCNDKDPPWMTNELKTAIKRKHRVFGKNIFDEVKGRKTWILSRRCETQHAKWLPVLKKNI